jgi:hypothetical protein
MTSRTTLSRTYRRLSYSDQQRKSRFLTSGYPWIRVIFTATKSLREQLKTQSHYRTISIFFSQTTRQVITTLILCRNNAVGTPVQVTCNVVCDQQTHFLHSIRSWKFITYINQRLWNEIEIVFVWKARN